MHEFTNDVATRKALVEAHLKGTLAGTWMCVNNVWHKVIALKFDNDNIKRFQSGNFAFSVYVYARGTFTVRREDGSIGRGRRGYIFLTDVTGFSLTKPCGIMYHDETGFRYN